MTGSSDRELECSCCFRGVRARLARTCEGHTTLSGTCDYCRHFESVSVAFSPPNLPVRWPLAFHGVGVDQVVCTKFEPWTVVSGPDAPSPLPVCGGVYTVRDARFGHNEAYIRLVGFPDGERFASRHFRPATHTDVAAAPRVNVASDTAAVSA